MFTVRVPVTGYMTFTYQPGDPEVTAAQVQEWVEQLTPDDLDTLVEMGGVVAIQCRTGPVEVE